MSKMKLIQFVLLLTGLVYMVSCSDDDDGPCADVAATYDGDVKAIINSTCAYSGCHDGTGVNVAIPAGDGDYTSYSGIMAALDDGTFNLRAITQKTMPPADFVPAGSPTELTDAQLDILTCWRDAGYPEN